MTIKVIKAKSPGHVDPSRSFSTVRPGHPHLRARADVGDLHGAHFARARMTPGARVSAAIEVVAEIEARRRPAADALKDWGLARRFAGSGDRAAIAGLVYDTLRRKASAAFVM